MFIITAPVLNPEKPRPNWYSARSCLFNFQGRKYLPNSTYNKPPKKLEAGLRTVSPGIPYTFGFYLTSPISQENKRLNFQSTTRL